LDCTLREINNDAHGNFVWLFFASGSRRTLTCQRQDSVGGGTGCTQRRAAQRSYRQSQSHNCPNFTLTEYIAEYKDWLGALGPCPLH